MKTYRIYYINLFYYHCELFGSVERALAYGKEKGFEFRVEDYDGNVICAWSIITGTRYF